VKKTETTTTALEKANPFGTALARPSFIQEGDIRGTENIGTDDIKPPALKLAQGQSPETKRSEPTKYIEGLREGEFFNTLTKEIYGEGPVGLVIVNQLGHRHVEFDPNDKTVVLDFNVPDGDPRTEFTTGVKDGKQVRLKPRATKFYDYLVIAILEDGRRVMMTMSLKSTQLKKAVELNTLLKGAKLPSFAFLFEVSAVPEKRGNNNFYGWLFTPKGYVDEAVYNEASDIYDRLKGKNIQVEDTGDGADEGDGGTRIASDRVPF
jgi:hypothetical protein